MAKYRLKEGKKHYADGKRLDAGSVVELTDDQAAALADRFELVAGAPATKSASKTTTTGGGLADMLMPDAIAKIEKLETVEALDAAEAEERAGKDRKGVHDAIADRRAELKES